MECSCQEKQCAFELRSPSVGVTEKLGIHLDSTSLLDSWAVFSRIICLEWNVLDCCPVWEDMEMLRLVVYSQSPAMDQGLKKNDASA